MDIFEKGFLKSILVNFDKGWLIKLQSLYDIACENPEDHFIDSIGFTIEGDDNMFIDKMKEKDLWTDFEKLYGYHVYSKEFQERLGFKEFCVFPINHDWEFGTEILSATYFQDNNIEKNDFIGPNLEIIFNKFFKNGKFKNSKDLISYYNYFFKEFEKIIEQAKRDVEIFYLREDLEFEIHKDIFDEFLIGIDSLVKFRFKEEFNSYEWYKVKLGETDFIEVDFESYENLMSFIYLLIKADVFNESKNSVLRFFYEKTRLSFKGKIKEPPTLKTFINSFDNIERHQNGNGFINIKPNFDRIKREFEKFYNERLDILEKEKERKRKLNE